MECSSFAQEPFEVLPSSNQERLTVDPPEPLQPEAPHPMPILGLRKEGFYPHLALAQGFLIGRRLLIGAHPLQILFPDMAVHHAPKGTRCTLHLDRVGIADRRRGLIELAPSGVLDLPDPSQDGPLWAEIVIGFGS
jgi:hypothetical protein